MAENYKSYRIRTNVGGEDNVLHVNLTQTYDTLEVLSLKIDQKNSYKTYKSDYGVVVGRVFANGGYGVPNAKISVFIPSENTDSLDESILYPFRTVTGLDNDNIRYNLLPNFVDVACHQDVGTFPNKRMVLDNDDVIEVFDKYYTYTTTTNNAGDYMLFGVPTGMNTIHMDVDLSDIGTLSQRPRDFVYKGYNIEQFDSPTKFKSSTNLSSLAQIMSEDKQVYVYSYWGDTSDTDDDIAITRCDFELAYKFEPTCVFMGSVITDTSANSISQKCTPGVGSGQMSELVTGSGTIEMIRKTFDNKVEEYAVNGNQNIDENGIWCYQIPMNLDYIITDEFGNIVPSNDPEKGIPTRARVRFRVSLNEIASDDKARNRSRYLIPNNPRLNNRYREFTKSREIDYEFGTMTRDEDYCDLFWNNVYTVKNYIPRMQTNSWVKNGSRHYGGIKMISHFGDNSPMPYNQVTTRLSATYRFMCILYKFILYMVKFINGLISYVIGGIIGVLATPLCALAKVHIWKWHPFGFFNKPCKALKKLIPSCIGIDGSVCGDNLSHSYTFYPGCGDFSSGLGIGAWINTKNSHYKNQTQEIKDGEREPDERTQPKLNYDELKNCIETSLGEEYDTVSFNFSNDWINGVLYMPLWWRAIRPKRSYFFGLIKKEASDTWCSSSTTYATKKVQKVQPCAVNIKRITKGSSNGCGKKNEGCMTAKSLVGFRHGYIVQKKTMLGQDVYYYAACEVDGDSTQIDKTPLKEGKDKMYSVKLLFATDIVLLGSLNDNDINGIPQFYKSLYNTTYNMPPTVLQATNLVSADVDEEGDVSYSQTSETEYTGRDWGNSNNDLCDSDSDTSKDGGLFYSIGCSSLRMTPKSCINAARICEFGVTIDATTDVITKEIKYDDVELSEVTEQIKPDGYISYDDLHNETQRSAFATMNGNHLITKINNETGLREYVFKYLNVDNFDGHLYELMQMNQSKCSKTQKFNYYLEQESEGYVDFRLGNKNERYFYNTGNNTGNYFPRYENSFYFYFGLKEGKTALDKLNKYYVSDCADAVATESPLKIISKGNDWCLDIDCYSSETNTEYAYNGYIAFDLSAVDLPCTILLVGTNDSNGNIDQREFIANNEKVYISTINFGEDGNPLPDELKGYTRIKKGIANEDITMVKNDTYEIYVTDNNGEIITTTYTVGPKMMNCIITPANFITPFNRLKEKYGSIYKIMANKDFEVEPVEYTSNVTRKIGGTINITWPKDGDTNEPLENFVIKVDCEDETIDYHIKIEVREGGISAQTSTIVNEYNALLFSQTPSNSANDDSFGGFIIGIPQGDSTYVVEIRQTCKSCDGSYPETNNRVGRTILITDKTQYKLYINGVDYDVIKHWKSGFNVQNINSYYGTAKIYEDGQISNEWFHLTDESNYHWEESADYIKIDKALVELVKAKNDVYNEISEDETLLALYNILIGSIGQGNGCNYAYNELINAQKYVIDRKGKNFLFYTQPGNTAKHRPIASLKRGLECEIDALTNNCIHEEKEMLDFHDYNNLVKYGQSAYEEVYQCLYIDEDAQVPNEDYVTPEEYAELGNYLKKDFSFYPYEFVNVDSGEALAYYGYNDLDDEDKKTCRVYNYIGCTFDSSIETIDNRPTDGDFDKTIPYMYVTSNGEAQCGTIVDANNVTRDVFVEPGYFTVAKWVDISNDKVNIADDNTITSGGVDCETHNHIIYKMVKQSLTYTTYIPFLGYNAIQYSNKKDKYQISTYIKVLDVAEYYKTYNRYYPATYSIYNYVKLKITLEDGDETEYVPYIFKTSDGYEYYDGREHEETYYIKHRPETISVGQLRTMITDWNESNWQWHGHSRSYEIEENGVRYIYVPQYAPLDRRGAVKYTEKEFIDLPTYGKPGYNIFEGEEMYRNIYEGDIKTKAEYNSLDPKGQNDFQPSQYLPLDLVVGAADPNNANTYGDTFRLCENCETTAISVYDYTYNNECTFGENVGETINYNVYGLVDYLQECYVPKRYISSDNQGSAYHFEFNTEEENSEYKYLKTAEELSTMSPYTKAFYKLTEYHYVIENDVFNNEQIEINAIAGRYFHKVNSDNGVYYLYIKDKDNRLSIVDDYLILEENNEEAKIKIHQDIEIEDEETNETVIENVTVVDEIEVYTNIIDNTDTIDEQQYNKLTEYTVGDYAPFIYEEIVGEFSLVSCDEPGAEPIEGYFDDIIAYDKAMIDQLDAAREYKNEFINRAKEAFWMSCNDNEHVLSFSAVTEDRPVNYHLVYKQEVAKENEVDGSTYNTLEATEAYICDGTTDVVLTIPTICEQSNIEWGNVCHPIAGHEGICFARDNTSGSCSTSGASDSYYRKAFFVSAVNGKEELIPDGTLSNKKVPDTFFGVHVLDKRFKNHIVVWPYIKGIPQFKNGPQQNGNTYYEPRIINMFGSIGGSFENGVTTNNELAGDNKGYYNTFATQTVEGNYSYDLNLYTYSGVNSIDEDRLGIARYVFGEKDSISEEETPEDVETQIVLEDLKNDIRETVFDLEEIELPYDFSIDTFKPFTNYKVPVGQYGDFLNPPISNSDIQCAILPYASFSLSILDNNNCGINEEINGNLEIVLDDRSVNDLRCCVSVDKPIRWGYKFWDNSIFEGGYSADVDFIKDTDETLLKVQLKNGDIDDFTFYAFECIVDEDGTYNYTYPLQEANVDLIQAPTSPMVYCKSLYKLKDFGDTPQNNAATLFKNTLNASKYIFGQNANPSFEITDSVERNFKYIHKQDSKTRNKEVFYDFLKYHVENGSLANNILGKVGGSSTTDLLYSVDDEVTLQEIMKYRNGMVRRVDEEFVSSEACKSCDHCKDNWKWYNPQPQGQKLLDGSEIDSNEYNTYLGFSRSGEFTVNGKLSIFYGNNDDFFDRDPKVSVQDDCEATDGGKSTVLLAKTCGYMDSTKCHSLFYIVAISNDGMRRAISPVYDFRRNEIVFNKVIVNGKTYYKINVKDPISGENTNLKGWRYYFWHYDYMVTYDIDFGRLVVETYTNEEGEQEKRNVFQSDVKVTGVAQHPAEKTSAITTMDCLIEIPPREEWGGYQEPKIEGTIILRDKVGLKHLFKVDRDKNTINNEDSGVELNTYTFKTNGGVWMNNEDNNIVFKIPDEYLNTPKDYVIMSNTPNVNAWKNDLKKQLKREEFGVSYTFNEWVEEVVDGNTIFTAQWQYNGESVIGQTIYTVTWWWKDGTVANNEFNMHYSAKAVEGVYVSLPNAVQPPRLVDVADELIHGKQEYQRKWRIPLAINNPDEPQSYSTINSEDYFIAGDNRYGWNKADNSIDLWAEYAEPMPLYVYFIDDGIDYSYYDQAHSNTRYMHLTNVQINDNVYSDAVRTQIESGTNVDYFNNSNFFYGPSIKNNFPYQLVRWETDTQDTEIVINNTIMEGVWNFNLGVQAQYNVSAEDETDLSLTRCILKIKKGSNEVDDVYELSTSNILSNGYISDSITYEFSSGDAKPTPAIGPNGALKITEVYISLDAGIKDYCFFNSTQLATVSFRGRTYTVCDSGCNITVEDSNTYKISFNNITPRQNG